MKNVLIGLVALFVTSMLIAALILIRFLRGTTNKEKNMFYWIAVLIVFIIMCVTVFVTGGF